MILMSSGKPRAVSAETLKAEVDALLARTKAAVAKRRPVAKPRAAKPAARPAAAKLASKATAAPKPVAKQKPKTRGGRLIQAEREVEASKPRDRRLCWRDMSTT
jgi:hypothetical protein